MGGFLPTRWGSDGNYLVFSKGLTPRITEAGKITTRVRNWALGKKAQSRFLTGKIEGILRSANSTLRSS